MYTSGEDEVQCTILEKLPHNYEEGTITGRLSISGKKHFIIESNTKFTISATHIDCHFSLHANKLTTIYWKPHIYCHKNMTIWYWPSHSDHRILTLRHWPSHVRHHILTTTYWPLHADHHMLTITCWPSHIDHHILTTLCWPLYLYHHFLVTTWWADSFLVVTVFFVMCYR